MKCLCEVIIDEATGVVFWSNDKAGASLCDVRGGIFKGGVFGKWAGCEGTGAAESDDDEEERITGILRSEPDVSKYEREIARRSGEEEWLCVIKG